MSEPEPHVPDPEKPGFWSVAMVLFALLLIIPGLCFGLVKLQDEAAVWLLGLWVVVLFAWVIVLLVKLGRHILR